MMSQERTMVCTNVKLETKEENSSSQDTFRQVNWAGKENIDPPGHGRIMVISFNIWCPSVHSKKTGKSTKVAPKTKQKRAATRKSGPGGSLNSLEL